MLYALNKNKISAAGPHNGTRRQQNQHTNEQHFGELSKMQLNNEIKHRDYNNTTNKKINEIVEISKTVIWAYKNEYTYICT